MIQFAVGMFIGAGFGAWLTVAIYNYIKAEEKKENMTVTMTDTENDRTYY